MSQVMSHKPVLQNNYLQFGFSYYLKITVREIVIQKFENLCELSGDTKSKQLAGFGAGQSLPSTDVQ